MRLNKCRYNNKIRYGLFLAVVIKTHWIQKIAEINCENFRERLKERYQFVEVILKERTLFDHFEAM